MSVDAPGSDVKTEREGGLLESERDELGHLRAVIGSLPDGVLKLSRDLRILWANEFVLSRYGMKLTELAGRHCYEVHHQRTDPCVPCPVSRTFSSGHPETDTVCTSDGKWFELKTVPLRDSAGSVESVLEVGRDVTERLLLEEKLRQSQKMDSLGRLAGGVAHDFNNLLTVILGSCSFMQDDVASDSPVRKDIAMVQRAAESAASLTRQLLAFSRREVFQLKRVDVNEQVSQAAKMLGRLLGEDITVTLSLSENVYPVMADTGQIEQIVLNLAVNARDAMPRGGSLTIRTENQQLTETSIERHSTAKPGPYAMLSVADSGCGMDAETQARVFEPFFTTKGTGKGTGLGLSTVFGIATQVGGFVTLNSQLGVGSQFAVYIPVAVSPINTEPRKLLTALRSSGGETVLIVEDVPEVRALSARILESSGYVVLEASGLEQAREHAAHCSHIDITLTDVVMPGGSSKEVADTVCRIHPGSKVIFMSGYTDGVIEQHVPLAASFSLLNKPFSADALKQKMREVLDADA